MLKKTYLLPIIFLFLSCSEDREKHLYLLIGQSNMAGRGVISEIDTVTHERVWVLDKQNQWIIAKEPVHFDKPERIGTGPGLAFGKLMASAHPKAKIGLIPCAVGGTIISMWQPNGYYKRTNVYPYDDAVSRVKIALNSGTLKGIIWHQGEYDSKKALFPLYEQELKALAKRLREEFNVPNLPFVVGGLGDFYIARNQYADSITQILSKAPMYIENCAFASVKGLTDKGDSLHFSAEASRILGMRYAEKMIELQTQKIE